MDGFAKDEKEGRIARAGKRARPTGYRWTTDRRGREPRSRLERASDASIRTPNLGQAHVYLVAADCTPIPKCVKESEVPGSIDA